MRSNTKSPAFAFTKQTTDSSSRHSPVPNAVSSSSSERSADSLDQDNNSSSRTAPRHQFVSGRAGKTSPSSICQQRRMSAALVTTPNAKHEMLEGREKILLPHHLDRQHSSTPNGSTSKKKKKKTARPSRIQRSCTVPIDQRLYDFTMHPPPLRLEAWAEAAAPNFKVRGSNYLQDSLKMTSEEAVFRLLTVDLVQVEAPIFTGMCQHPNERIQKALAREQETGIKELPDFVFAVNLCIPGQSMYHWIAYFGCDDVRLLQNQDTPLGRVAYPFFFGRSDEFRNNTFKLIPRIVDGNFVVRKAVGSKPSILGRKLKQYYIQHERFFEIIVDIGSEKMAERIVRLALGYAKTLVVDMMFLLEGTHESMLPERILGGVRIRNVDFNKKDGKRVCYAPNLYEL